MKFFLLILALFSNKYLLGEYLITIRDTRHCNIT
jgi:hypothetical protein